MYYPCLYAYYYQWWLHGSKGQIWVERQLKAASVRYDAYQDLMLCDA